MKPLQKMELIGNIGRELQDRMTFSEIDSYFETYGIPTDHKPSYNSKFVYVREVLPKISNEIILQIAEELNIEHNFADKLIEFKDNSTTFWRTGHFKLFISHISSFKKTIGILKSSLEKYGVSSFVAHDDIEPTKEWQDEILKSLFSMDALCAVLMPGFKESNWTDQEVGVAIGRDVLVIPIRRELDPYGFIGKNQGFQSIGKNIDEVAEAIFIILTKNPKTRMKIISCLIDLLLLSNNKKEAIERLNALKKIKDLPIEKLKQLHLQFTDNKNLRDKDIVREFNYIAILYSLPSIKLEDFDNYTKQEFDELPF